MPETPASAPGPLCRGCGKPIDFGAQGFIQHGTATGYGANPTFTHLAIECQRAYNRGVLHV